MQQRRANRVAVSRIFGTFSSKALSVARGRRMHGERREHAAASRIPHRHRDSHHPAHAFRVVDPDAALAKVDKRGVPVHAILLGTVFGYVSVVMSSVSPDTVFAFLVNSYGTVALFVYVPIAFPPLRLRKRPDPVAAGKLRVRRWAYPYLTWIAIVGMVGILVTMAFIPDPRKPLWLGVASLGVRVVAYGLTRRSRREYLDDSELPAYPPRSCAATHDAEGPARKPGLRACGFRPDPMDGRRNYRADR